MANDRGGQGSGYGGLEICDSANVGFVDSHRANLPVVDAPSCLRDS